MSSINIIRVIFWSKFQRDRGKFFLYDINCISSVNFVTRQNTVYIVSFITYKTAVGRLIFFRLFLADFSVNKLYFRADNLQVVYKRLSQVNSFVRCSFKTAIGISYIEVDSCTKQLRLLLRVKARAFEESFYDYLQYTTYLLSGAIYFRIV